MVETLEVAPEPGEVCSCGRPAVTVYVTERWGRVGDCGVEGRTLRTATDAQLADALAWWRSRPPAAARADMLAAVRDEMARRTPEVAAP